MRTPGTARQVGRATWLSVIVLLAVWFESIDLLRASWPFVTDDMYISLRYAQNWAEGFGPAWNRGDGVTVEGFSNPAFVALGAGALALDLDPVLVLRLVSVLGFAGASVVLLLVARRVAGPVLAVLPAVLLLGFPGTAWWAASGLETGLYVLLVTLAYAAFLRGVARGGSGPVRSTWLGASGAVVALAGTVRPEAPLVGLALALTLAVTWGRRLRVAPVGLRRAVGGRMLAEAGALAGGFALLYGPALALRLHTFGQLVPNSVLCKAAGGGAPGRLVLEAAPLLGACLWLARPLGRRLLAPVHLVPLAIAGLYVLALLDASTSVGYLARHFLAAFALLTVPAAAGLAARLDRRGVARRLGSRLVVVLAIKTALFGLLAAAGVRGILRDQAQAYARRQDARARVAAYLRAELPPGATYLVGDVGKMGYDTPRLAVLDAYCLNSPEMTSPDVNFSQARFADLALRRAPEAIVISSRRPDALVPRSGVYRQILARPEFHRRYELRRVFGAPDDTFHYFVYLRHDP